MNGLTIMIERKQNKNLSAIAYIVQGTAKQVISRRGENEACWETCITEKTLVRCVKNYCFSLYACLIVLCGFLVVLAPWFIPDSQYHDLLLISLLCKQIVILFYFCFSWCCMQIWDILFAILVE